MEPRFFTIYRAIPMLRTLGSSCWSPMRKPVSSNSASNLARLRSFGWQTDSSKSRWLGASVPLCEFPFGNVLAPSVLAIHFRSKVETLESERDDTAAVIGVYGALIRIQSMGIAQGIVKCRVFIPTHTP